MPAQKASDHKADLKEPAVSGDPSPRPHTNEEIVELMKAEAQKRAEERDRENASKGGLWNAATFLLLWAGVFFAVGAIAYVVLFARDVGGPGMMLAAALALALALFLGGAALKMFSPTLFAGALLRRAAGQEAGSAAGLAGADILGALGLAERVLDADQDARLVTRRDGSSPTPTTLISILRKRLASSVLQGCRRALIVSSHSKARRRRRSFALAAPPKAERLQKKQSIR